MIILKEVELNKGMDKKCKFLKDFLYYLMNFLVFSCFFLDGLWFSEFSLYCDLGIFILYRGRFLVGKWNFWNIYCFIIFVFNVFV